MRGRLWNSKCHQTNRPASTLHFIWVLLSSNIQIKISALGLDEHTKRIIIIYARRWTTYLFTNHRDSCCNIHVLWTYISPHPTQLSTTNWFCSLKPLAILEYPWHFGWAHASQDFYFLHFIFAQYKTIHILNIFTCPLANSQKWSESHYRLEAIICISCTHAQHTSHHAITTFNWLSGKTYCQIFVEHFTVRINRKFSSHQ